MLHCQLHHLSPCMRRSSWISNVIIRSISSQKYDIVISGGGMVGTAAAAALGMQSQLKNYRILLLESAPKKSYTLPHRYSNRVSAISPASRQLLEGVGAWKRILQSRLQPVKHMYVWESCSDAFISFSGDEADADDNLAYIVENDLTVSALMDSVADCSSNVDVLYNTSAVKYEYPTCIGGDIEIHLSNSETISTKLLVGADGFKSLVRTSAELDTTSWNYDQVGVVYTLKLDKPAELDDNHTAWQRFLPTGPIAVLPLSKNESSLVWSTIPEHGRKLMSLTPEEFVAELNKALTETDNKDSLTAAVTSQYSSILNQISPSRSKKLLPPRVVEVDPESRAMFPYGLMHANKYVAPRLALVGDACHRIHPLAGQGVNLGFGDVECLVRKIVEAANNGIDIGWIDHLHEYETERQRHVVAILAGCDGLYRLYSNSFTPLVLARSLGLMTVNAISPAKEFFMRRAQN